MQEKLDRRELPIQSIYDRDKACTATVPIHLDVMSLPGEIRIDPSLIADAGEVVKPWYDEDMEHYLSMLRNDGTDLPHLRGYERFGEDWELTGEPDENGFLALSWRENSEVHSISFTDMLVILNNQHDQFGDFFTPEACRERGWIEILYRDVTDPEGVLMSPEKMRRYGVEKLYANIKESEGIAEVVGNVFSSDYHMNMAKTLLLRDFAVFYLNRLLETTSGD